MKRFKDASLRAQWWNYSSAASYFVTICTKHRIPYFGKVMNGVMEHSEIGQVAFDEFLKTVGMRPQMNLSVDEFIVMPDHVHLLITIGVNLLNQDLPKNSKNEFSPQSNNLASIVRGYKSAVTQYCRINGLEFSWQSRYYDVIIRDQRQFEAVKNYIKQNPKNYKVG